ncbi:apolipoprotein N-acyltransferase [bacterium F11]|nr:apolipoprotein N-acyltransferase [bacterium F11]
MIILSLVSGILFGLSFPPFGFSAFAWFCLVPVLYLNLKNSKQASMAGLLTGMVANGLIFIWLWKTLAAAQIGIGTTLFCWTALSLLLSLYFLLFFLVYYYLPTTIWKPWIVAFFWIVLNHIQTTIFTGFPWAFLGMTQAYNLPLIQMVSITGVEGITFLIVVTNVTFAEFLKSFNRGKSSIPPACFVNALVVLGLLLGWHLYGLGRLHLSKAYPANEFRVAILQGNIDQYKKWNDTYEENIREVYANLARKGSDENPDLMVWPESAVPGWFPNDKYYHTWIKEIAQQTKTHHIIGAVTTRNGGDYNSAFLINPNGEILSEYAKQHLVPFGEYIPFGESLDNIFPYLGQLGVFTPGNQPLMFQVKDFQLTPNICYEAIFSNLIRKNVRQGADVIVNLTNDGWYLDTGAPEQHYISNIFRAVEMGKPVIRAANTGISAVIDPWGRELLRSPLLVSGIFCQAIPIPKHSIKTLYLKWGSWFFGLAWLFVVLYTAKYVTRIKRKNRTTHK